MNGTKSVTQFRRNLFEEINFTIPLTFSLSRVQFLGMKIFLFCRYRCVKSFVSLSTLDTKNFYWEVTSYYRLIFWENCHSFKQIVGNSNFSTVIGILTRKIFFSLLQFISNKIVNFNLTKLSSFLKSHKFSVIFDNLSRKSNQSSRSPHVRTEITTNSPNHFDLFLLNLI